MYHGNLEVRSDLRQDDEREFYALADRHHAIDPFRSRAGVHVQVLVDRDEARARTVRDEGPGFDASHLGREIDPEDLMPIGGRGLLLIGAFMDEVAPNAAGNAITMTKRRSLGRVRAGKSPDARADPVVRGTEWGSDDTPRCRCLPRSSRTDY